jgi:hypothetical protein
MATFGLFGQDFELAEGQNTFTAIGSYVANVILTLDSVHKHLAIVLKGLLCGADVNLSLDASIELAGGRARLVAVRSTAATNRVTLQHPQTLQPVLDNPTPSVHPDDHIGVEVADPAGVVFNWLNGPARLPLPTRVYGRDLGALVHFDVRSRRSVHRPAPGVNNPYQLLWQDKFSVSSAHGPVPAKSIGPMQALDIGSLWFDDTSYEIEARPVNGALFLHADILDTSRGQDNELLFQYAVANGRLRINGPEAAPAPRAFWSRDTARSVDPAIVMLRHQDEHGHPIALVPVNSADVPLTYRDGVTSIVHSSQSSTYWDVTNAAMVIGAHGTDGGDWRLECRLSALDPLALYDTFADPAAPKNSLERPAFLKDGVVPLSGTPGEIHGLSRGAWLERNKETSATAHFKVQGIEPTATGFTFHHSDLVLGESADWTLVSLAEERDITPHPVASSLPNTPFVGAFRAAGTGGALHLPAIDLHFALANLAGPDRVNAEGNRLATGILPGRGHQHLAELETQLSGLRPKRFGIPILGKQQHISGMRVSPPAGQAFARVLDELPTAARSVADTARPGAAMAAGAGASMLHVALRSGRAAWTSIASVHTLADVETKTNFIFGGDDGDVEGKLAKAVSDARETVGTVFKVFERAWRGNVNHPLVTQLRQRMGIVARPQTLTDLDQAGDLLQAAYDYLHASDNVADITDDPDALLLYLDDVTAEEFTDNWANPADSGFNLLLEHVWSPANNDLLRRIVRILRQPDDVQLMTLLFGTTDLASLSKILTDAAEGLLTGIQRGVEGTWGDVRDLWANGQDPLLVQLRSVYGSILSRDVYARLLDSANATDAAKLLEVIQSDLGLPLASLGDLATDPPDYLFRTQRFPVDRAGNDDQVRGLWSQCFDLCSFMEDKAWYFFLDSDSSVIVKLTQKRSLADLLQEIDAHYSSAQRPDPLAVQDLQAFLGSLDADLLAPDWTGVFVIRPVADISDDKVLRDLVGFDHITAAYIAVGGRKPASRAFRPPHIDVWAHVFKQTEAHLELTDDPLPKGDVKLALTKFDVRIRQSQLSDADIEVEIHPKDVWGRQRQPPQPGSGEVRDFDTILLRGTLAPPGKDPTAPRDLVFSAFFPQTFVIPIDLAFVKELRLSALRVARRSGVTCIEIDGSLVLQNKVTGLDLKLDLDESPLLLQDFRIQLPALPARQIAVGTLRNLNFDFPAVQIAIGKPRAFNLFGIEMVPRGLGYIRGSAAALNRLRDDYLWLRRLDLSAEDPNVLVSYVEFDADFGKLPAFGLVDARGLRFQLALALKIRDGATAEGAYLGIAGLDARDLKIDLFRLLTLEIEELRISPAKLIAKGENSATQPVNAGAILAEKVQLKILNWSPLPEGASLDLLLLHPTRDQPAPGSKGMLVGYEAPPTGGTDSDKFFRLHWALLAHNLQLPSAALSYLLGRSPGDLQPIGLLGSLITKPPEGSDPHSSRADLVLEDVKLLDRESWLFGLSFGLGELFTQCNFVLHDQHYYGIHLWAPWVEEVFQQDSIELAYIPGATRSSDRFRTNLRIPGLDMLGSMKSGEFAIEWAVNWDFLVDVGFPWRTSIGYDWFRSFSIPVGAYEGKFGFYFEKRTTALATETTLTLSAGVGLYVGYYFGAGNSIAWVRAGIGVFAIMQGAITFRAPASNGTPDILRASIEGIEITGIVGIFAYGEGGVDVWILSARFRVSAQASLQCTILYVRGGPCSLSYAAMLEAAYSASVRVGCGFCSWTFSVSGSVGMGVSGQLLLS